MDSHQISRKRLALHLIAPELVCTLVGVIIAVIKFGDDPDVSLLESSFEWVVFLNAGAVAHQLTWLLALKGFKWESSATFRGIWRQTAMGVLLTFVFVYLLNIDQNLGAEGVFRMFLQVVVICVIVHIFLFQFKFYAFTQRLYNPENVEEATKSDLAVEEDFIPLNYDERIEKVDLKWVSYIKVEDHYCTVLYQKGAEWLDWTVYEKLKTFEEQYSHRLIRVNRSTLVNPQMVEKVERAGGKHLITMKGDPDSSFPLSSSQKHLLEKLIPVIS